MYPTDFYIIEQQYFIKYQEKRYDHKSTPTS
jgi:hypothetical protein